MQGRFGSQEVDAEELGESEEGGGALGEMVEGLLDDLLERVDASLDRARAQLKANPGATADVSNTVASVAAPPAASQVAGAQPCIWHFSEPLGFFMHTVSGANTPCICAAVEQ